MPPFEEGLVIPTFGIDPDADSHVLPDFQPVPPPAGKAPAERTRFDPEGRGPRQGMSFLENLLGTFHSGTIEGALNEAETQRLARGGIPLPETTAIDQGSGFVPELSPEAMEAVRQEARQGVYDQVAYDLAPINITPRSVAGSIAGQLIAPSNLLGFGAGAVAKSLAARGIGEAGQAAATFGVQGLATSAATQAIRSQSGASEHLSLPETLLAGVAGSVLGAGTHVVGHAIGKAAGGVAEFVRNRREVEQRAREILGTDLPREALLGGSGARGAEPTAEAGQSGALPPSAAPTARTAPPEAALRSEEPAPGMPVAEPDPTAPVSREQVDGRAEGPLPGEGAEVAGEPTLRSAATIEAPEINTGAPTETFDARTSRLTAERDALAAAGPDNTPGGRELHDALASADSERNADPAWAARHVDDALTLGRRDIAEHIAEGAERRAVEAERVASEAAAAEAERDTPGTRYDTAVAKEDAEHARSLADGLRQRIGREEPMAPARAPVSDRRALDERSSNAPPAADRPRDLIGPPVPALGEHRVTAPGLEPIRVAPVVVEASALRTSADAGFDRSLQPRQRERAASQEQIRDIATNLEPERLGVSAEADRGAPIVGGDRMVESGNGRVLAIRRAYEQGGEAAERYRAWLGEQGIDVSGYREPVLVRQRLTPLTAEERRGFTDAANRAATLAMSAPERAMADARLVTADSLDLIRNVNDLGATSNREFVRTLVARLPQAERGAMITAEGGLSSEGLARVRNAVLAKAYDHAGVLSRIAEATSDDVKSISNALVAAAPDWAKLRADIARGAVREDVDLTAELLEAVTRTADLRAKGVKLDTFLAQQDAFDRLPRPVEAFMRMFADEKGRRAAGAPVVAERLRAYATEARKVLADQGLDLGMPAVSAEEIQAAAARRGQRAPEGEGALLFSRRQPTDPRQLSFFDRVAEGLRNAKPTADTKRAGEAADFLHGLGTEMADRAGREGPEAAGSALERLRAGLDAEVLVRPPRDPFAAMARDAAQAEEDSFSAQLARELQAAVDEATATRRLDPIAELERALAAQGIAPPPAAGLITAPETGLVEAATRLHGAPAERTIPLDELRAALPGQSAAEVDMALAALADCGVARVSDRRVHLDPAAVREVHAATERYVRTEAEDIGRALFGPRAAEAEADALFADLERGIEAGIREARAEAPRPALEPAAYTPPVVPPRPPAGRPTALEARVLRAVRENQGDRHTGNIWDLRAALPDVPEADLKEAMLSLQRKRLAVLSQYSDPRSYRGKVGIDLGGGDMRHVIGATPEGRAFLDGRGDAVPTVLLRRKKAGATVEEPDMIRQGRPVEDQGTPILPGDTRPERLEVLAKELSDAFEAVLRTGGVQPGARGQYNVETGVARVREVGDLGTKVHELGHKLQQSPQTGRLVDPVIARNRAELAPLGAGTGATGDAEAFAELMRLYATSRAFAARQYPQATADLERTLAADLPKQAAALDKLRVDLDTIARAESGAVVSADVITSKPAGILHRIRDILGTEFIGTSATDPRGGVFYTWADALYTHMLSPHHPINRAMDVLGRIYRDNTGKTVDLLPQDHAYILARVSSGARATADAMLNLGVRGARDDAPSGPSLRDAIEAAIGKRYSSEQWHELGAYLTARRMVAEYERKELGEIANPPGKLSAGDYAKAVEQFEAKYPTFADGAEKYYEFNRNLLQRHYDLGLFTKEYYDAAMARKDYAPLMRDMEDLGQGSGGGGRRDGASMMKAFRGSQRSVLNPLESTVKKVHDLEQAAALNETKAALARLAEIAGPGSGFIAEPIPSNKMSSVAVDIADALRTAGHRANVDHLDLNALIVQAEGLLGDDVFTHIFRQEKLEPGREPVTFYYVNGERRALRLSDDAFGRELYTALNHMTAIEKNIFKSLLEIGGAYFRQGVTLSLGFIYRNVTRDQGTSVATGARGYLPFIGAIKGAIDVIGRGGDFEKYLSQGGFAGGVITEALEGNALTRGGAQAMFRERGAIGKVFKASTKLAELSEAATRAGLFQSYAKQAEAMGFDAYNAALYAAYKTNDYIDFRKVGSHIAPFARAIPFLNASLQGTDREARGLFGDMVRLEAKRFRGEELSRIEVDTLKDARAAWVKTLGWGLMFGAGNAYLNSENPEWFGAAEWRRQRGYNLMPLGPPGHWLTMPKPFGFVRNVSDLMEHTVEYLMRGDPTIAGKLGRALWDAHTIPTSNPIISTFVNVRANYDPFRERPIVPESLQRLPAAEQYTRYTSEIAKAFGRYTGWSPMKVDYAMRNLGGARATDWLTNASALIHYMQGKPQTREKTVWDLPLMRELTQNLAVGNAATQQFYGLVGQKVGKLESAAAAQAQKIRTGDRRGAADYVRGLPEAERVYATLMNSGFDAEDKLMHPLVNARAYSEVVQGVSRAVGDGNLLAEGDLDRKHLTLSRRDTQPIYTSGPTTEKLRNELDALSMVTARNALIAFGAEGMQGVPVKDPAEFMDRIRMLSPDVARELRGRLAAKRLYDPEVVAERWPEVKARLLKDGENAEFNDLLPRRARNAGRARKRALNDD